VRIRVVDKHLLEVRAGNRLEGKRIC
jgi:hypothetical protein